MKRIATIFVVLLCALALASSAAFADQSSMGKCNFMPKGHKMWSEKGHDEIFFRKAHFALAHAAELGLSDDQVSKIKAIEYTLKKNLIKEDANIKSLGLDVREAIEKDAIDTNAVNSLIDQKYAIKSGKAKETIQAYADLKKILTKDQYNKLKEMRHHGMCGKTGHRGNRKENKETGATQEDNE